MVNILEVDVSDLHEQYKGADKLETIFKLLTDLSAEFATKYSENGHPLVLHGSIHSKKKQASIRRTAYYLVEELMEGMNLLKNREWMTTEIPVDEAHMLDEMADMLHYVFLLLQQLGIGATKMFDIVLRKMKVNQFRLRSGY